MGEAEIGDVVGQTGGEVVPAEPRSGCRATGPRTGGPRDREPLRGRGGVALGRRLDPRRRPTSATTGTPPRRWPVATPTTARRGQPSAAACRRPRGPRTCTGHRGRPPVEQLPDPRAARRAHPGGSVRPTRSQSPPADRLRRRSPHRERRAGHALVHHRSGPEHLPQPAVVALGEGADQQAPRRSARTGTDRRGERWWCRRDP